MSYCVSETVVIATEKRAAKMPLLASLLMHLCMGRF
jgi:hypothetical protein